MSASHSPFPRRLALAIAALFIVPAAALAAPDAAPPAPPSRADIERLVERAQAQAREATEHAREQTREALEQAERYRQAQTDAALAQLDFDLDYSTLAFIGSEFGPAREIVKNAPYTADAVTESIQVLQDGNRIVKRSTTKLARDTYGRTRQEKESSRGAAVYIFDPIDNRNYVLNPQRRTATRIPRVPDLTVPPMPPHTSELAVPDVPAVPGVAPIAPIAPVAPVAPMAPLAAVPPTPPTPPASPAPGVKATTVVTTQGQERVIVRRGDGTPRADDVRVEVIRMGAGEPGTPQAMALPPIAMPLLPAGKGERKSLGTRDFDGVKADGTQTTQTIPAGEIGNEKPIVIVSERWFSPELQLVVFARTRDPRAGETTYRLTNLKRGEPPAELFRVPADYRARESRG